MDGFELVKPTGTVVACRALKRSYREAILNAAAHTWFVHLHGTPQLLEERMLGRQGHFMKASMLQSQHATLQPLEAGEPGRVYDIALPVPELVQQIAADLR